MNINKAIRKQEKSNKRFLLTLCFIFFVLPLILFLSGRFNIFLFIYLFVIELLILIAIVININNNYLKYSVENYKLKIKLKKFGESINILCDKVAMVFAEGKNSNMEIIIITTSKFRNKNIKPIDENLLKKYPYLAHKYYIIKKHHPENNYFYIIINKGGYNKYRLLDLIYKNCITAYYSEEAIERIKEYRLS